MRFEWILLAYCFALVPFAAVYATACMSILKAQPASYSASFSKPLESLRGVAATLVVFSHTTMYFYAAGQGAGSKASSYLGQSGVIWFFMLTGYLFWNMVLAERLNLNTFYEKRLRRLVPAMTGMVSAAILYEWIVAGFPRPNQEQILAALRNYAFYFAGGVHDVFVPEAVLRINNLWTLRWEWLFYIALPIVAALTRSWRGLTCVLIVLSMGLTDVVTQWRRETDAALFLAFYLGMSAASLDRSIRASLERWQSLVDYLAQPIVFVLALLLSLSTMTMPADLIRSHNLQFVLSCAPVFFWFLMLSLSRKPDRVWLVNRFSLDMGRISYSVYLWHLLIAYVVHKLFQHGYLPGFNTRTMYLLMPVIVVAITMPLAVLSYRFLEHPFMSARLKRDTGRTSESSISGSS